jgi:hypothetical protein
MAGGPPVAIMDKLPVTQLRLTREMIDNFESAIESSKDERPLQKLFEEHPQVLVNSLIGPHTVWVFERPRLPTPTGGLRIPDFMICDWTSIGPKWTIVELESPREKRANKAALSAKLNHAIEQIVDYRSYLSKYAQLTRDAGFPGMHLPNEAVIVIGRRSEMISETNGERLAAMRQQKVEVATYDRLLEQCEKVFSVQEANKASLEKLLLDRPMQARD